MAENKSFDIFWTDNALLNSQNIKKYLQNNFSLKEIDSFFSMLQTFEKAVSVFPMLYPVPLGKRISEEQY